MKRNFDEVYDHLTCSITKELMNIPVLASDGFTYEKEAIEEHFSKNKKTFGKLYSPMTREEITNETLCQNRSIKSLIEEFRESTKSDSLSIEPDSLSTNKKRKTDYDDFVFNYEYIEKDTGKDKEEYKEYESSFFVDGIEFVFSLKKLFENNSYGLNVYGSKHYLINVSEYDNTFKYEDKTLFRLCTTKLSEVEKVTRILKNALYNNIDKEQLVDLYPTYSDIVRRATNSKQAVFNILMCIMKYNTLAHTLQCKNCSGSCLTDNDKIERRKIPLPHPCSMCSGLSTTMTYCCKVNICLYCMSRAELNQNKVNFDDEWHQWGIRDDDLHEFECPACSAVFTQL